MIFTVRPVCAVVHRAANGQPAQRALKFAAPEALIGTVLPAGQVIVRAVRSTVKSSTVNPPVTALCVGHGLMSTSCPVSASAASASPVP